MRNLTVLLAFAFFGCDASESSAPSEPAPLDFQSDCVGKCDDVGETGTPEYEFIVVGSGAGGGPLAANLARAGFKVLLLEAGDYAGHSFTYQVPSFHALASEDPKLSWGYEVNHYADTEQAQRDHKMIYDEGGAAKGILYPRGATLGGSTAVNAMITVYPHESDWDGIAELTGDASWRGANMRKYFQRVERNGFLGRRSAGHGFSGWLGVERFDLTEAITDLRLMAVAVGAVKAFVNDSDSGWFDVDDDIREMLALLKRDVNEMSPERDQREGFFSIPKATDDGKRNGSAEYVIRTLRDGYPLSLKLRSLVTKVILEPGPDGEPRAVGVEYLEGDRLYRAHVSPSDAPGTPRSARASKEVILSAGAFNTPQLLMLSGIGDPEELEKHGIETVVELPGVGRNLQDRYEVGITFTARGDFRLLKGCTFGEGGFDDPCMREWADNEGPYVSNGAAFGTIKRSSSAKDNPDLFIFGAPGFFKGYYPGYSLDAIERKDLWTWVLLKAHTENQAGRVTLKSADPRQPPAIDFNYFHEGDTDAGQDQLDLQAMVEGVQFIRELGESTHSWMLTGHFKEVWPGPEVQSAGDIAQFVKDEAWGHHASCTAAIGPADDPMAVLDSDFRVRGVEGLRVVDASVFPRIPGFFIVTPVYMISEKASEVIAETWR